ncbi:MAG: RagB/SusD family nutrient uptake outer membrane protein, partial [Bacteroidales bacterium]|nr:RagB/SusD family nutrient uptake outer membrane protein [Bacteroidales bacterium]
MKQFKYIMLGAALMPMAMLTSCESNKDFLTEKPKSILTIESAYKSNSQVLATILSAYNEYEGFFFDGAWGANESTYRNLGTDVMDANNQLPHYSNFKATWSTDAAFIQSVWDRYYRLISFCNLALSQMNNVSWDSEAEKTREIGEALFLRGVSCLELGVVYGGVPLVTEFSEVPRFDYERATRQETLQLAIDNLKEAFDKLPESAATGSGYEIGRATKSAAALYLSKAFLALGVEADNVMVDNKSCWENAQFYANHVITNHPIAIDRFGARIPSAQGSNHGVANAFPQGNVFSDLFVSPNMQIAQNTEAIWVMVAHKDYATYTQNGGHRNTALGYSPAVQDMNWSPEYIEEGAGAGPWKVVGPKYGSKTNPAIHGGLGWGMYPPTHYAGAEVWDAAHNNSSDDYRYTEGVTVRTKYLVCDPNHSLYEQYVGWEVLNKHDENTCSKIFPIFYKETPLDEWDYDAADPGMFGNICYSYRNKYAARSGEAYLLLAEALYRDGKNGQALEALNTLRARSNANPFSTIDINIILDERVRELYMEEFRWFTLLRMKPEEWK